jgi:geranylgeranyl reductase family protein
MNRIETAPLPAACDVLVIGAGPAGSACAQLLTKAGIDVHLVDQHDFPRDKTCGDGLIPDAHAALKRLGVHAQVMALAHPSSHVRCVAPSGVHVDVPGTLAVLPRKLLDEILLRAAVRAGAQLHTPWRFEAPITDSADRVIGARLKPRADSGAGVEVHARHVVLATGATPQALIAAGMCERRVPSAIALRGYVRHPGMTAKLPHLEVVWHKRLVPGYGWIFPCADGVFNIGVGVIESHDRSTHVMRDVNLREVFMTFCDLHAGARELMAGGTLVGELKGAPLRSSLVGARFARPGLLVTGEAGGSTYSFTGEGIGKAMETGMLAAEGLIAVRSDGLDEAALAARYEAAIAVLKPKFDLYEKGNKVNSRPWMVELLVCRARRSERLRQRMANLLEERSTPAQLFSLRGLVKLFIE